MKDNKSGELDAVMTSLHYLESEVSKVGLKEVSGILKKTISDIEGWINTGSCCGSNFHEIIIGYELFNILELLHKLSQNYKYDLAAILRAIESYTAQQKMAG